MDKNYRALELDKILEMLAQETTCADAAEKAALIAPVHTATQAQQLLEETDAPPMFLQLNLGLHLSME